jgi:hypothetical protein
MPHLKVPHIVYKYTSQAAARAIIANRTLRIGRPTEMNDPFDNYIDDLFDVELKDRYNAAAVALVDMLSRDPDELVASARALNEDVAIFQARITPGAYALSFEPIAQLEGTYDGKS